MTTTQETKIREVHGLTESYDEQDRRIVKYAGLECPLIQRRENLCIWKGPYLGSVLDTWETYKTPLGVVLRHYWSAGAGLERDGVDWELVPVERIAEAQERFKTASAEVAAASEELEFLVYQIS